MTCTCGRASSHPSGRLTPSRLRSDGDHQATTTLRDVGIVFNATTATTHFIDAEGSTGATPTRVVGSRRYGRHSSRTDASKGGRHEWGHQSRRALGCARSARGRQRRRRTSRGPILVPIADRPARKRSPTPFPPRDRHLTGREVRRPRDRVTPGRWRRTSGRRSPAGRAPDRRGRRRGRRPRRAPWSSGGLGRGGDGDPRG